MICCQSWGRARLWAEWGATACGYEFSFCDDKNVLELDTASVNAECIELFTLKWLILCCCEFHLKGGARLILMPVGCAECPRRRVLWRREAQVVRPTKLLVRISPVVPRAVLGLGVRGPDWDTPHVVCVRRTSSRAPGWGSSCPPPPPTVPLRAVGLSAALLCLWHWAIQVRC